WRGRWDAYRAAHSSAAEELRAALAGELPAGWDADIPDLSAPPKPLATRVYSGQVLQGLGRRIPNLLGGSADLAGSNKTTLPWEENLLAGTPGARTIHFGVREHAMGAILNGMALHGGVRPYGGTFLIFSDYMRPAIRLAALMHVPVTYVFTHDSIGVGEDGPTHQPIEQLMSLRAIPGVLDLRPGDGPETAEAWRAALAYTGGPSFLALTRQAVAIIDRHEAAPATGLHRGGYVLLEADGGDPEVILIASGSEVGVAVQARAVLQAEGVPTRVVSLPSWFLFARQPHGYRDEVLPPEVTARVSVEAGTTAGWTRWTGDRGASVGIDHFGASAPGAVLFEKFGITAEAVVAKARALARVPQPLPG
ncbi:MAG: transketolase, partial [Gammaproteobacteria bacterium]|nr:transketolase [Gammaproteobacteria bacterium]